MASRHSAIWHRAVNKVEVVSTVSQHWHEARQDVLESLADASAAVQATNLELRQGLEFICSGLSRAAQAAHHTSTELRKLGREIGSDFVDHLDGAADALRICEHSGETVQHETFDRLHESMRRVNMTNSGLQQLLGLKVLGRMTAAADEMREISVEVHKALGLQADALHYQNGWEAAFHRHRGSAIRHARRMASRLMRCLSFVAAQCAFATWRGVIEAARATRGQIGRAAASAARGSLHEQIRSVPCLREALVKTAESVAILHERCLESRHRFGRSAAGRLSLLCFWAWRSYISLERKTLELQQRQLWQICQSSSEVNDAALCKQHLLFMLRIWRLSAKLHKRTPVMNSMAHKDSLLCYSVVKHWRGEVEQRRKLWLTRRLSAARRLLEGASNKAGLLILQRCLQTWKHGWQVECLTQELRQTPIRIFEVWWSGSLCALHKQLCFRSWQQWCRAERRRLHQLTSALKLNMGLEMTPAFALMIWRTAVVTQKLEQAHAQEQPEQQALHHAMQTSGGIDVEATELQSALEVRQLRLELFEAKRCSRQQLVRRWEEAVEFLALVVFAVWKVAVAGWKLSRVVQSSRDEHMLPPAATDCEDLTSAGSRDEHMLPTAAADCEELTSAAVISRVVQSWRERSLLYVGIASWRGEVLKSLRCALESSYFEGMTAAAHVAGRLLDAKDVIFKRYFFQLWQLPIIVHRSSAEQSTPSDIFLFTYERLYCDFLESYYLTQWSLCLRLNREQGLHREPASREVLCASESDSSTFRVQDQAHRETALGLLCEWLQSQLLEQCCFTQWRLHVDVDCVGQSGSGDLSKGSPDHGHEFRRKPEAFNLGHGDGFRSQPKKAMTCNTDIIVLLCERLRSDILKQCCFGEWHLHLIIECAQRLQQPKLDSGNEVAVSLDEAPQPSISLGLHSGPWPARDSGHWPARDSLCLSDCEEIQPQSRRAKSRETFFADCEAAFVLLCERLQSEIIQRCYFGDWHLYVSLQQKRKAELKSAAREPQEDSSERGLHFRKVPEAESMEHGHKAMADPGKAMAFNKDVMVLLCERLRCRVLKQCCFADWCQHLTAESAQQLPSKLNSKEVAAPFDNAPVTSGSTHMHSKEAAAPLDNATVTSESVHTQSNNWPARNSGNWPARNSGHWPARDSGYWPARDSCCMSDSEEIQPQLMTRLKSRKTFFADCEAAFALLCERLQLRVLERCYFSEWQTYVSRERILHVQLKSGSVESEKSVLEHRYQFTPEARSAVPEKLKLQAQEGVGGYLDQARQLPFRPESRVAASHNREAVVHLCERLHCETLERCYFTEWQLHVIQEREQQLQLRVGSRQDVADKATITETKEEGSVGPAVNLKCEEEVARLRRSSVDRLKQQQELRRELLELRQRLRVELAEGWCSDALRSAYAAWALEASKIRDARQIEELSHELQRQQDEAEYLRSQLAAQDGLCEEPSADAAGTGDEAAPSANEADAARTTSAVVPLDGPGEIIEVPHPDDPRQSILVAVPLHAVVGQTMLVPVPDLTPRSASSGGDESEKDNGDRSVCERCHNVLKIVLQFAGMQLEKLQFQELVISCIRMWRMHTLVMNAEMEVQRQAEALRKVAQEGNAGAVSMIEDDVASKAAAATNAAGTSTTGGLEPDPEGDVAWMDAMQRLVDDLQRENASLHATVLLHQRQALNSPGLGTPQGRRFSLPALGFETS